MDLGNKKKRNREKRETKKQRTRSLRGGSSIGERGEVDAATYKAISQVGKKKLSRIRTARTLSSFSPLPLDLYLCASLSSA